jgi:hypothetical protein
VHPLAGICASESEIRVLYLMKLAERLHPPSISYQNTDLRDFNWRNFTSFAVPLNVQPPLSLLMNRLFRYYVISFRIDFLRRFLLFHRIYVPQPFSNVCPISVILISFSTDRLLYLLGAFAYRISGSSFGISIYEKEIAFPSNFSFAKTCPVLTSFGLVPCIFRIFCSYLSKERDTGPSDFCSLAPETTVNSRSAHLLSEAQFCDSDQPE